MLLKARKAAIQRWKLNKQVFKYLGEATQLYALRNTHRASNSQILYHTPIAYHTVCIYRATYRMQVDFIVILFF